MAGIRHAFVSPVGDSGDPNDVSSNQWNEDHVPPYSRSSSPPAGYTSIDEFNDGVLAAAWVRVDASGTESRADWYESSEVASGQLRMRQTGGDAASQLHALVRPISAVSVGDAFETRITFFGPAANYTMGGIILTDGTAYGSGDQVLTLNFITGTGAALSNDARAYSNFSALNAGSSNLSVHHMPYYVRLVLASANTWRCDISPDGTSWLSTTTVSKIMTPTHAGFLSSSWGTTTHHIVLYDFLRRTSGVS